MGGFEFDNTYELVSNSNFAYENKHVPFAVLVDNKDNQNLRNVIVIDHRYIPKKYSKIKILA